MNASANRKAQGAEDFAIGTVVRQGPLHHKLGFGLQDACWHATAGDVRVAVVCDGCSTAGNGYSHNLVGARLGAELIANELARALADAVDRDRLDIQPILASLRRQLHERFRKLCNGMGFSLRRDRERYHAFVLDTLMFTVVGCALLGSRYWIFGVGDGYYGIDDKLHAVPAAAYLNESLLRWRQPDREQFRIYAAGALPRTSRIWIASDGLAHVINSDDGRRRFDGFLDDEQTCTLNRLGEDATLQAFRRRLDNARFPRLVDDLAIVIFKSNSTNN